MVDELKHGTTASPAEARGALKEVVNRGALGERGRKNVAVLATVLRELELARGGLGKPPSDCPSCGAEHLSPTHANEHMALCPQHPSLARLRAVREALQLAPGLAGSLGLEASPVADEVMKAVERALVLPPLTSGTPAFFVAPGEALRASVSLLAGLRRDESPESVARHVRGLEMAVLLWERLVHRESDPCRFCGAVTPLDNAMGHAHACKSHPAAHAGASAEACLEAQFGAKGASVLVAQLLERDRYLAGLEALLMACSGFDGELGRGTEGYTSSEKDEAALKRAILAAEQLVWFHPLECKGRLDSATEASTGPAFARPAWRALLRVGQNGPTPGSHCGTEADGALLRKVVAEAVKLEQEFGDELACPACERPGLWAHRAVSHVTACPCHPAKMKERDAEARLAFAVAVLKEKRPDARLPENVAARRVEPLQRLSPSPWLDEETGKPKTRQRWVEHNARGLPTLLMPARRVRYEVSVDGYTDEMASALSAWTRYRALAEAVCPYCDTEVRPPALFAHLAECPEHPAVARAEAMEATLAGLGADRLEPLGRVRREAVLARYALARLVEHVECFVRRFGDGERGRGIVYRDLMPMWNQERQLAKESLERLLGDAGRKDGGHPAGAAPATVGLTDEEQRGKKVEGSSRRSPSP